MKSEYLIYRSSMIHYVRSGHDGIPLICFHGYGEEATTFGWLAPHLAPGHALIAIDLPFHGRTVWNEDHDMRPDDLMQIVETILEASPHPDTPIQRPQLLGYSLGGRIALSLYQLDPAYFQKVVLLAPDGLRMNPWYWFATQTRAGNLFFRFTMQKPGWFFGILRAANKLGLVNSSVFKFVNHYIGDPEVRRSLFQRWTGLRRFRPSLKKIRHAILQQHTPFRLVFGRFDRIIKPGPGQRFCASIANHGRIRTIRSGHQLLQPEHADVIREEILG